eukprot:TRINITY_DN10351_c0_g1_i3.p1 TRINITY_DN10351_c0_g1~~TRINITY_DN10351_c0_g1_i3.p1  ORF type:complete len:368 (-),score=47.38 TRINITY_DN10351_c0_g1_i3:367-1389(-)
MTDTASARSPRRADLPAFKLAPPKSPKLVSPAGKPTILRPKQPIFSLTPHLNRVKSASPEESPWLRLTPHPPARTPKESPRATRETFFETADAVRNEIEAFERRLGVPQSPPALVSLLPEIPLHATTPPGTSGRPGSGRKTGPGTSKVLDKLFQIQLLRATRLVTKARELPVGAVEQAYPRFAQALGLSQTRFYEMWTHLVGPTYDRKEAGKLFELFDTNAVNAIPPEEFNRTMSVLLDLGGEEEKLLPYCFRLLDGQRRGYISKCELEAVVDFYERQLAEQLAPPALLLRARHLRREVEALPWQGPDFVMGVTHFRQRVFASSLLGPAFVGLPTPGSTL